MRASRKRLFKFDPPPLPMEVEYMAADPYIIGIISDLNRLNASNPLKMRYKRL